MVDWSKSVIEAATGFFGSILFQWLPTMMMHLCAIMIPYIIHKTTLAEQWQTRSEYKRKLMIRIFSYLVLSTFVMPSLLLTSVDGALNYVKDESNLQLAFQRMFLPSAGAFFINYVLQMVMLKNAEDIMSFVDVFKYCWKLLCCAGGILFRRAVTNQEKYDVAQNLQFGTEKEFAFIMSVLVIVISYSLLSPIVLGLFK